MAAGGRVAGGDFQGDAGQAEVAADEVIGQVEWTELEGRIAHPLGPGAVDADGELRRGIGLARALDGAGRDPDLLLFGKAEELVAGRPVDDVPERDLAPIAADGLPDEIDDEAEQRVEIALPEPDPVGQRPGSKIEEGSRLEGDLLPP